MYRRSRKSEKLEVNRESFFLCEVYRDFIRSKRETQNIHSFLLRYADHAVWQKYTGAIYIFTKRRKAVACKHRQRAFTFANLHLANYGRRDG